MPQSSKIHVEAHVFGIALFIDPKKYKDLKKKLEGENNTGPTTRENPIKLHDNHD